MRQNVLISPRKTTASMIPKLPTKQLRLVYSTREWMPMLQQILTTPHPTRVLLVEDEDIIAMFTEEMLALLGYEIGASVATLKAGLEVAAQDRFEVAILDVNLRGSLSFPIADVLLAREIPFIFASGYTARGIEPTYCGIPMLQKPFTINVLGQLLSRTLASSRRIH